MGRRATPRRSASAPWIALGLAAAVFAIYARVAGHEFLILDDDQYVTANGHVRAGLTLDGLRWACGSFQAANWHPLTWLSHMLDVELFGLDPAGHHLVSVALHAANAVLLFAALRFMTGATWPAAFAAALFAVHPLRVESVAWVSERKDVLAGLFWMTTLLSYAWYARRPEARRYLVVLLSLALGLMAKPMLVTLPFVLLLLDRWPLGRWVSGGAGDDAPRFPARAPRALLLEKLPLIALAALSSVVTVAAQRSGGAASGLESAPFALRLANALTSYGAYLWKTLWPTGLAYFYPHPAGNSEIGPAFWAATAVAALLLGALTYFSLGARSRPYLAVGWLWFLGTLVPVIGLVQVGAQARADRYTYVPLIGIYLAVAWGVAELARRRPAVPPLAAAVLLVLAALGWQQAGSWKDGRTLFEHALAVTSRNHVAETHLGTLLNVAGDLDGAEARYRAALAIEPDFADALSALGVLHGKRGDLARAAEQFRHAVTAAPRHADAHHNLGLVLRARGDLDGAEARFREAVRLRPLFSRAWLGLGQVAESRGDRAAAAAAYARALEIDPADEAARTGLARVTGR